MKQPKFKIGERVLAEVGTTIQHLSGRFEHKWPFVIVGVELRGFIKSKDFDIETGQFRYKLYHEEFKQTIDVFEDKIMHQMA